MIDKVVLDVEDGKATYTVASPITPIKEYLLDTTYLENDIYDTTSKTSSIRVLNPQYIELVQIKTGDTILTTQPYNCETLQEISVTVRLVDKNRNKLSGVTVVSTINNSASTNYTTDSEGCVTRTYTPHKIGNIIIFTFKTARTSKYVYTSMDITMKSTVLTPVLEVEDVTAYSTQPHILTAKLYYKDGSTLVPIAGRTIEFLGTNRAVLGTATTNNSGIATLSDYIRYSTGTMKVYAVYTPTTALDTGMYNRVESSFNITTLARLTTSISSQNVSTMYKTPVSITGTLTSDGTALSGQKLLLYSDDTLLSTATTNNSGIATFRYTPSVVSDVILKIRFEGAGKYASTSKSVRVTVNKLSSEITAVLDNSTITYPESVTIKGVLIDANQNPRSKTNIQIIDVSNDNKTLGTTLTATDGTFSFKTSSCNVKTTQLLLQVSELTNYLGASTTLPITVNANKTSFNTEENTIRANAYETVTLQSQLIDVNGEALSGKSITFTDGTNTETLTTDTGGYVETDYSCNAVNTQKKPVFTFKDSAGNYTSTATIFTVNFTKIKTYFIITNTTAKTNTETTLKGRLLYKTYAGTSNGLSNVVCTFKIGSTTLGTCSTDENGYATVKHTFLDITSKEITLSWEGSSTYTSATTTYTVNPEQGSIVENCTSLSGFMSTIEKYYQTIGYGTVPSGATARVESDGIHVPYGVRIASTSITTTNNCKITIHFKVKVVKTSTTTRGVQIGLLQSITAGESAPVRLERTAPNSYAVQYNKEPVKSLTKYAFDTWHTVEIYVEDSYVGINIDEGTLIQLSQTVPVGLHPYFFSFTPNNEVVIDRIEMIET